MKKILLALTLVIGFYAEAKVKSNLSFDDAHVFVPMKGSRATGGFATVKNQSDKEINLVFKSAKGFKHVETHRTFEKDGQMVMEKVENYKIEPKGTLELKQGGNHLMLFDPTKEFKKDEKVELKFTVDGKDMKVMFKALPRVAAPEADHSGHSGH